MLIPDSWQLPERFRERLGDGPGRQRAMLHDGHLLLVLHRVPTGDLKRTPRLVWRDPVGNWKTSDSDDGIGGLEDHLAEYETDLESISESEEAARCSDDFFRVLSRLGPILRSARHLHATLQEAREGVPGDRDIINCRDRSYRIERTAELLSNDARTGLDVATTRRAEEQANASLAMSVSAHRLNLLAAFFFPLATLATIFGTNFNHGMDLPPAPIPFVTMLGVGLFFGVILAFALRSRPR